MKFNKNQLSMIQNLDFLLKQAQGFTGELQDVLLKINDLEGQLITSKPVGGMPETAKDQLDKFMVSPLSVCFKFLLPLLLL